MPSGADEPFAATGPAARIPLLRTDEMSDRQRKLHDAVVNGPRGRIVGPLLAAMHSPELAERWSELGSYLRFETSVPLRLKELAIVVTGRRWGAQVEWWVHAEAALAAGVDAGVIDAIRDLCAPTFAEPAELELYEYVRLLQQDGQVPDKLYRALTERLGVVGIVELTAVIGYYTMVAMTLNAHRLPVPDGSSPLPHQKTLVVLAPGRYRD